MCRHDLALHQKKINQIQRPVDLTRTPSGTPRVHPKMHGILALPNQIKTWIIVYTEENTTLLTEDISEIYFGAD
jgi:hypothetical protein